MLKNHPAADAFPMMDGDRLSELKADINTHGQREPITICEGMILDGRNRYKACIELGITPNICEYTGDPWSFAWSMNGARRDLDAIVRALIYKRCEEGSAKWAAKLKHIADEGRRKKAEAAKGNTNAAKSKLKTDADHNDPHLKSGPHVARQARAEEAKVSPATMARAEQIAKHPELADKVVNGDIKPAEALRVIRSDKRRNEMEEKARSVSKDLTDGSEQWTLLNADVLEGLSIVKAKHGQASLIFTDPPYNIGIDYGTGKKADSLPDSVYMEWVGNWMQLCRECLTEDGSLWVMIGDEYAAEYAVKLKACGFAIRSWIKWYETFGVNCTNKFNRTSRHIFYAVKSKKRFIFNADAVTRPSDRQTKYGDIRAVDGGKLWDDVWQIPRLTGNSAERIPTFPTQLPLALVEPIVLCASMPGDLVVDPFNGSGTTGEASVKNGRRYVGVDQSEEFLKLSNLRLKGCVSKNE